EIADIEGNPEPVGDHTGIERGLIATADTLDLRLGIGVEQAQMNPDWLPTKQLQGKSGDGAVNAARECNEDTRHQKNEPPACRRQCNPGRRAATPPLSAYHAAAPSEMENTHERDRREPHVPARIDPGPHGAPRCSHTR